MIKSTANYRHSQRSGHLLDVLRAIRVEDVADLEHLQGLLDLPLLPQDQPLDVVCVLAHSVSLLQLRPDDGLADLELAPDIVGVDQPVATLKGREFGCWKILELRSNNRIVHK